MALTFMAKPNQREGNSCHIHLSLRDDRRQPGDERRRPARAVVDRGAGASPVSSHAMRDLDLLLTPRTSTPTSASSRRSFAPTAVRWGVDNRTCALRLVGHGDSLRVENRVPGGDVNPYLALAGMVAAGCTASSDELDRWNRAGRQRLRRRGRAPGPVDAARRAPTLCDGTALWSARRSATRWSTHYAQHGAASNWPRSTRR